MKKPMKILITNDDGIHAPGLFHLWQSLKDLGEVVIVAPASERSGAGIGITLTEALHVEQVPWVDEKTLAYRVSGTPADCAKIALSIILDAPPDMIVSGINRGTNAGRNVLYSGTIGGVIEGTFRGIPGMAISCCGHESFDYASAKEVIPDLVRWIQTHPLPQGTFLNVNIPFPEKGVCGIKMARQGKSYWIETPLPHDNTPSAWWLGGKHFDCEEEPESDIRYIDEGYITVVPIHVDELTDLQLYKSQQAQFNQLFSTWSEQKSSAP